MKKVETNISKIISEMPEKRNRIRYELTLLSQKRLTRYFKEIDKLEGLNFINAMQRTFVHVLPRLIEDANEQFAEQPKIEIEIVNKLKG